MSKPSRKRAFIVVIDAFGVGAMPDAPDFGDSLQCSTLGGIDAKAESLHLPNLEKLGLGHLGNYTKLSAVESPLGRYGKMAERSIGKDTTTGHWEMAGIYLDTPFPTYPEGFPPEIIEAFIRETGCGGVLGNIPASGTAIIEELGEQHLQTGWPIVYTSADSVFQIACHVERIPLETLYQWCEIARNILSGQHEVSRVIARPFEGPVDAFSRIGSARHDYAVSPPEPMVLSTLLEQGVPVIGVGKIRDIFCGVGVSHSIPTKNNADGLSTTTELIKGAIALDTVKVNSEVALNADGRQLVFVNLVETDMNYGHRRDVQGYAQALEAIDEELGRWLELMKPDDLLVITADHGCDPTAEGTDHTREYVPVLVYSPSVEPEALPVSESFADVGRTVLDWLLDDCESSLPGNSLIA